MVVAFCCIPWCCLGVVFYGLVFAMVFLWCGLGCYFLMFLCGNYCGSRLFCFNCGFASAGVLWGVVRARVFVQFSSYCVALDFIIVAGCGSVLAESSYCCVLCHPGFSIVRFLACLRCLACSFLFISVVAVV